MAAEEACSLESKETPGKQMPGHSSSSLASAHRHGSPQRCKKWLIEHLKRDEDAWIDIVDEENVFSLIDTEELVPLKRCGRGSRSSDF